MRVMLSAGEASGDVHGAHLAEALKQQEPAVQLSGMGGPLMAAAGVQLHFDPTQESSVGFTEAVRNLRRMRHVLAKLAAALRGEAIDVLVAIDLPAFNMRLVEAARRLGIPAVYYFSPSAWAWGKGRARRVARSGAHVCAVFPFEADVYRQAGAQVTYVGHPLLDMVHVDEPPGVLRRQFDLDPTRPVVALLPGSRKQELARLLTPLGEALAIVRSERPEIEAVLPLSHTMSRAELEEFAQAHHVHIVEGGTHRALAAADAGIVASGTATLEAAILGTPQIVVYRTSALTYHLAKRLIRIDHIALPNIVAERTVVPELLQDAANGPDLARRLLALLDDANERRQMQRGYDEVKARLGGPRAIARTAATVLALGRGEPAPAVGALSEATK